MTVSQQAVESGSLEIQVHNSMVFVIHGTNPYELNRIDTAVRSCKAVEEKASGWTGKRVSDDSSTYLVVFKHGVQVGQHRARILELIAQQIPGIVIHTD